MDIPESAVTLELAVQYIIIRGIDTAKTMNSVQFEGSHATADLRAWMLAASNKHDLINLCVIQEPILEHRKIAILSF